MKHTLERQEHLTVRQGRSSTCGRRRAGQVVLRTGAVYQVRAAILCIGDSSPGPHHRGRPAWSDSGPDGMHASGPLTEALTRLGLPPAPLQDRHAAPSERPEH